MVAAFFHLNYSTFFCLSQEYVPLQSRNYRLRRKKSPFFLNYLSENRDFIGKKSLPLILYVFILEKSF